LIQSYLNEYDLQWNLNHGLQIFYSFNALEEHVLKLFDTLPTDPDFTSRWYNLSAVHLGTVEEALQPKYYWSVTQTTNTPSLTSSFILSGLATIIGSLCLVGILMW
jgi:hypothetical protein